MKRIFLALACAASAGAQDVTIHAARLLDGRGGTVQNALITVRDGRITSVQANTQGGRTTYELGELTLLPGLIDVHVHPGWYINSKGALHRGNDGESPSMIYLAAAGNMYATLSR